jgi:hypothetical protein
MAVRGTAGATTRWELSHRYLTDQIDRATNRTVLAFHLLSTLKVGVEYNADVDEVGPVVNWRLLSETDRRPAVILGTSSDRIGTPSGRSYYATVSKSLESVWNLPIAPYAGVSYGTYEDEFVFPFGVNFSIRPEWSALFMYDGVHAHLSTTYVWKHLSITLLLVEMEDVGFSLGVVF